MIDDRNMKPLEKMLLALILFLCICYMIHLVTGFFKTGKAVLRIEYLWRFEADQKQNPVRFWIFISVNLIVIAAFILGLAEIISEMK
jgi:hypothetical protein